MATLFAFGQNLVSHEELSEKVAQGTVDAFVRNAGRGSVASLELSVGTVSTSDLADHDNSMRISPTTGRPFEEVGLGKPLTVELLAVYTGDAPGRSVFNRVLGRSEPDMLVVSGVKSLQTFGAAPRAINQIVKEIKNQNSYRAGALREGSPIVFYSAAMVDSTTFASVELIVDSFSDDVFVLLSNLFLVAAGLPVFAPAAAFLVAGSQLTKMVGKLGNALLETPAFLSGDIDVRFLTAGLPSALARFVVLCNDADEKAFADYHVGLIAGAGQSRPGLLNRNNEPYRGASPYVIASLDGSQKPELEKFAPQLASASLLEQFYGTQKLGTIVNVMQDAMNLYNDMSYRQRAERLLKDLRGFSPTTEEYAKTKTLLDANVKNIGNELLRAGLDLKQVEVPGVQQTERTVK